MVSRESHIASEWRFLGGFMANKEHIWVDGFEYVDGSVNMRATATSADWSSFPSPGHVDDPRWNIYNSNGKDQLLNYEWLFYTLENGRWKAKIHATLNHRNETGIVSWFEHCRVKEDGSNDGYDCHDAGGSSDFNDKPVITFYDWDGKKWEAEIGSVLSPFNRSPQFKLRRL
jgi:hypothetical protein